MDIIEQIRKVEAFDLVKFLIGFAGVVSPGLLILYFYQRTLFISLDSVKLMLLSTSLSLPIILINYFLLSLIPSAKQSNFQMTANLLTASFMASLNLYAALLLAYFLALKFHSFIWLVMALQAFMSLSLAPEILAELRKKKS